MSKENADEQVFDVQRVRELIELMKEHELNEVDLRQDKKRIRLRRGPENMPMMAHISMKCCKSKSKTGHCSQ